MQLVLLQIHLIVSIIAIFLWIIRLEIVGNQDVDVWGAFKEMNDKIEEIKEEKTKEFWYSLMNNLINNPDMKFLLIFLLCVTPILNILVVIKNTSYILKNRNYK